MNKKNDREHKINNEKIKDTVQLTLVIDENKTLNLNIGVNEDVTSLCNSLSSEHNIEPQLRDALIKKLNKSIERVVAEKKKKEQDIKEKKDMSIKKLYYDAMERQEKKKKFIEKQKEENFSKFIENCTFTPKINPTPNLLYKRDYNNIGDKLYNDYKTNKDRKYFDIIGESIKNREKQFATKKPQTMSTNQSTGQRILFKPSKCDEIKNKELFGHIHTQESQISATFANQNKEIKIGNLDKKEKDVAFDNNNIMLTKHFSSKNEYKYLDELKSEDNLGPSNTNSPFMNMNSAHMNSFSNKNLLTENISSYYNSDNHRIFRKSPRHNTININSNNRSIKNTLTSPNFSIKDKEHMMSGNLQSKSEDEYDQEKHHSGPINKRIHSSNNINNTADNQNINNPSPNNSNISPNQQPKKDRDTLTVGSSNISPPLKKYGSKNDNLNLISLNRLDKDDSPYKRRYSAALNRELKPLGPGKDSSRPFKDNGPISKGLTNMIKEEINSDINIETHATTETHKTTALKNFFSFETDNPLKSAKNIIAAKNNLENKISKQMDNNVPKTIKIIGKEDREAKTNNTKVALEITKYQISKRNETIKKRSTLKQDTEKRSKLKQEKLRQSIRDEYTFKPYVSDKSQILANKKKFLENKSSDEDIFSRLFSERRKQRSKSSLNKTANTSANYPIRINSISDIHFSPNQSGNKSFNYSHVKINNSLDTNKTLTNFNSGRVKDKSFTTMSPMSRQVYKKNIREMKSEAELKDCLDEIFKTNEENKQQFGKKIAENLDKFKLNNLKEIFEIIYNNCTQMEDLEHIENYGISTYVKTKLILPTCFIIKERELEFNFQNFYLISNEIFSYAM